MEKQLLNKAFDSNWIAPVGPEINQFEKRTADYININHACALSSGTSALHLALRILNIQKGDYILCPSLTFAASANVILYENALPVFIDSENNSWTIDPTLLEFAIKKYKPKALITVDLYGQSCNYNLISEICKYYNIPIVEDSAEALGSEFNNKKLGSYGDLSIFSFNGNKIITTSSGGMLLSNNADYIRKAKYLSTQARDNVIHYEHKALGYNYRMSNLLAAIGIAQLENINSFINKRRKIYKKYYDSFSSIEGITFFKERKNLFSNCWLTTFLIDKKKTNISNMDIIKALEEENIESRPVWKPMHLQPLYKGYDYLRKGMDDISGEISRDGICLPSGSSLTRTQQDKIVDLVLSKIENN